MLGILNGEIYDPLNGVNGEVRDKGDDGQDDPAKAD